jgi:dihydropteroate synthase
MQIGGREFQTKGHTYVMGILNVTPDSFSDGGKWAEKDSALYQAQRMIEEGADILDIGGESTRPGSEAVLAEEEAARVLPILEAIKARFEIPLSVDTTKAFVAQEAIKAGADLINDISGLQEDAQMGRVIAEAGLPCVLMHNRKKADYTCFMQDVAADLSRTIAMANRAGIADEKIILDPGIGFAKTYEQNLEAIDRLGELHVLGYPLLLGCSRKSVIGLTLDLPVDERLEGTLATSVLAAVKDCMFVRVHDVKENVRAIRMTEAILHKY